MHASTRNVVVLFWDHWKFAISQPWLC